MSVNLENAREELLLFPILDSIQEALVIVDSDLRIIFLNSKAEHLFEVEAEAVKGNLSRCLSPVLDFDRVIDTNEKCLRSTIIHNDSEYAVSLSPISGDGEMFGAYAIIKPLESLPRQQLETFLTNPYEAIIILDDQGNVTFANAACYNFFRCDSLEDLKKHLEPFTPNSYLNQAVLEGKPVSGDNLVIRNHRIDITYLPVSEKNRTTGVILKCKIAPPNKDWNVYLQRISGGARYVLEDIVGRNPRLITQKEMARKAARTTSTVLITGESGTGKEIFAHAVHNASPRSANPFIMVNCAAVPETLLESELFGYAEGAFTGAKKGGKPGKFELAHQGTIFLDEIADMTLSMQAKLLRVIQDKELERVGDTRPTPVDVRVISATNQNLEELVRQGRFRDDLYYRLNVVVIELPPLREREEDIEMLTYSLLERLNRELATRVKEISPEVMEIFLSYSWPGNIRELENVLERAVNFCETGVITIEHLPPSLRNRQERKPLVGGDGLGSILRETEREMIIEALKETRGNKSKTAQKLNIHRSALYRKMKKYGLGP